MIYTIFKDEYKTNGIGMNVIYGFHQTPFGKCLIATTQKGICHLSFLNDRDPTKALSELKQEWFNEQFCEDIKKTQYIVNQIFEYKYIDNILLKGSIFQIRVWKTLLNIPLGETVSYKTVAKLISQPTSIRAVANAIAKNAIAFLIPCHRVIASSGKIHKYRWGGVLKQNILEYEASICSSQRDNKI